MQGSRGFTLLELLVVLVLVGLLTGLVAPLAARGLLAARERAATAELRALLEGLPVRSFSLGLAQSYDDAALGKLMGELPSGWTLRVDPPLRYGASGVASGGTVALLAPDRPALNFRVLAVSGEVMPKNDRP